MTKASYKRQHVIGGLRTASEGSWHGTWRQARHMAAGMAAGMAL